MVLINQNLTNMEAKELHFDGSDPKSTPETFLWEANAKPMINRYIDHLFRINTPSGKRLKALMVDGDKLRQLLLNTDVNEVALLFAVREDTLPDGSKEQHFTTVIAGINHQNGDPDQKLILENDVFDYCQPCPAKCPINFYTLLNRSGDPNSDPS